MPIDKIIPRFLVSDEDERLLKEGAMTDALNVTISEDGDGSEGVLKNVRGTEAATAISGSELTDGDAVTVIGQVSDSQRGYIYFFVADNDGDSQHAIYQYDVSQNTYKKVIKSSWLDFQLSGFVKADVVNGAFQQDGVVQTIIYFTDNHNPPRKINVDRAIAGDYDDLSDAKLDYALSCIKGAPIDVPTTFFETDTSLEANNFTNKTFQFALQYIYTDGEESAISGYSRLTYPEVSSIQGIESEGIGRQYYEDNICNISTNWSSDTSSAYNIPDVEKIRIIARDGNDGAFFIVDEFNPNEDLTRVVLESSTTVFDKNTGVYKFYNDGLYGAVDTNTVNKLYDNVPLVAQGQAAAGNRLFFSDYKEGFENHDVSATISVNYSAVRDGGDNSTSNSAISENTSNHKRGQIIIDCDDILSGITNFPAGTSTRISFEFDPEGSFNKRSDSDADVVDDWAIVVDFVDSDGYSFQVGFGNENSSGSLDSVSGGVILKKVNGAFTFQTTVVNQSEATPAEFAALLVEKFENIYWTKTYTVAHGELPGRVITADAASDFDVNDSFLFDSGSYTITTTWSLNTAVVQNTNEVLVTPSIQFASINGIDSSTGLDTYAVGAQSFNSGLQYYINNETNTNVGSPFSGASWHEPYSAADDYYLSNAQIFSSAFFAQTTFKAGCTHDLGVVYYDKYNRSGNVNKVGTFYVEPLGSAARSNNEGASYVTIDFTSNAPDWAERYQIVYPGMNSYSSVVQYTTGGAFYNSSDDNDKRVYVSLKTLNKYRSQKGALRAYSFTEGDKLRVIRRDSATGTSSELTEYVRANDGTIIEFNVVGVLTSADYGVDSSGYNFDYSSHSESSTEDPYTAEFLILESPAVMAGLETEVGGSPEVLKYQGFDWFSLTGGTYPTESSATAQKNYWGQKCVVEILTPKKAVSERVYYEVGESRRIGTFKSASVSSNHGPAIDINSGDMHFTPISCVTPWRDTHPNHHSDGSYSNWNELFPNLWRNETIYLESDSVSDFFPSKSWDKGRAHVVYDSAAEIRLRNGVTYSDAYAEDVVNLSLSSFNTSLANFDSLDGRYGAVEYIGNYNDDLVALQENKLCLIPVNKNILEYASGSADVAVSTNVLGQRRYSSGDYGSGGHPEAVLIQDSNVYFVDESRQAVCALTGGQLVPISEKNMSSFFENFFTNGHTKYVSGYDPRDNTYYLTGLNGTDNEYKTVGYDAARGAWQSRYSFQPDLYSNQNNMLYSAKYVDADTDLIFHKHDNTTAYNTFYGGTASPSTVQVVSKLSPSRVKVFNAISYEGDSDKWEMSSGATTNLGQTSGYIHDASGSEAPPFTLGYAEKFQEREGAYYASMPRDLAFSSAQYVFLGTVSAQDGVNLTMDPISRLNRLPFRLEQDSEASYAVSLAKSSDGITFTALGNYVVDSFDMSSKKIVLTSDPGSLVGQHLYAIVSQDKPMRGNFATITLANSSTTKHELYCINTHVTDSKSHHPLGQ
jgi:hypothetical protein